VAGLGTGGGERGRQGQSMRKAMGGSEGNTESVLKGWQQREERGRRQVKGLDQMQEGGAARRVHCAEVWQVLVQNSSPACSLGLGSQTS
jgi:hypothetical protein